VFGPDFGDLKSLSSSAKRQKHSIGGASGLHTRFKTAQSRFGQRKTDAELRLILSQSFHQTTGLQASNQRRKLGYITGYHSLVIILVDIVCCAAAALKRCGILVSPLVFPRKAPLSS
jgi:hypothetical protein